MNHLSYLGKALAPPLPDFWIWDGFDMKYRFVRLPIEARPDASESVYAYVTLRRGILVMFPSFEYVGRAEELRDRLNHHERLAEAIRRGATELWVHTPSRHDPIGYYEAERRLIETYKPPMCRQRPAPLGRLGSVFATLQSRPASPSLSALGAGVRKLGDLGR